VTGLLALRMDLDAVIATVTANTAKPLGMANELGTLQAGRVADISLLDHLRGRFVLSGNSGAEVATDTLLKPASCRKDGIYYEADSPLVPSQGKR